MSPSNPTFDQIEEAVLQLPLPDRSRLAARLIDSLDDDTPPVRSQTWATELSRRAAEIDRGAVAPVPAEEVWRRVNQRFGGAP